ncbi:GtrA family protein [Actinobacteria bacterium OK074]|nr:GtrA family protein [Actinobacteria bacterium OK074]
MNTLLAPKPKMAHGTRRTDSGTATATGPGPIASFARFVLCGGGVGVLSSAAVPLLAMTMPWAVSNALITVVSTILCTELHALFTFGTGKRPGWRQHLQSAGSATAAYVATCAAVFILHAVQSSPSMLTEQAVYLSASGLAGIGRFLVLRVFVFATGRNEKTAVATTTTKTEPTLPTPNRTPLKWTALKQTAAKRIVWSLPPRPATQHPALT